MWGFLLIVVSVAVAAPRLMGNGTKEDSNQQDPLMMTASSFFKMIDPLNWSPFTSSPTPKSMSSSPTINLNTIELARYHGYEAESHETTTEDGYILTLQRLPGGRLSDSANKEAPTGPRPVVLLHHAYLLSSREYLVLGPEKSLGFILADKGYDVWFCNARGSTYSRNHTTLSPKSREFWDFSYTEYGVYDLPAALDFVTKETGTPKVHYIGHSIGTLLFFIMGSERPQALRKVRSFTGFGPVTSTMNCRSTLLRLILNSYWPFVRAAEKAGQHEFLSHYPWITTAGQTFCRNGWITQRFCTGILYGLAGNNGGTFDTDLLPEILTHSPAGSSLKTFEHFAQNFHNGFRNFDYGADGNLKRYGHREAPFFNLTQIDVPTQLFYGLNDLMADFKDAEKICKAMPNVFNCHAVEDEKFNHLDFVWADNAHTLVYPKVLEGLRRYEDHQTGSGDKLS